MIHVSVGVIFVGDMVYNIYIYIYIYIYVYIACLQTLYSDGMVFVGDMVW